MNEPSMILSILMVRFGWYCGFDGSNSQPFFLLPMAAAANNLQSQVRSELQSLANILSETEDHAIADVWRVLNQEVRHLTIQDRVQGIIARSNLSVGILDHHCITTRHGYSFQTADIIISHQDDSLRMIFRYERQAHAEHKRSNCTPTVSYTIDLLEGSDHVAVKLLWVQIWAADPSGPSPETKLIDMMIQDDLAMNHEDGNDETDGSPVEGLDERNDDVPEPRQKKLRTNKGNNDANNSNEDGDSKSNEDGDDAGKDDADHYLAGVDNDLLDTLRQKLALDMEDADACQFLLKFPFVEREWDIDGMLFDALFDYEDII